MDKTQFKKGDMRRIWFLLGAVEILDRPTLTTITAETGLPKATVNDGLNKLMKGQIPGLIIEKEGAVYSIKSWGDIVKKNGVTRFFSLCKRN